MDLLLNIYDAVMLQVKARWNRYTRLVGAGHRLDNASFSRQGPAVVGERTYARAVRNYASRVPRSLSTALVVHALCDSRSCLKTEPMRTARIEGVALASRMPRRARKGYRFGDSYAKTPALTRNATTGTEIQSEADRPARIKHTNLVRHSSLACDWAY